MLLLRKNLDSENDESYIVLAFCDNVERHAVPNKTHEFGRVAARVVRPGGVAAATVWDNFGGMPSVRMFWDIAAAIEPRVAERRDAVTIRPMTQSGELRRAFSRAGFHSVTEAMLTTRMDFTNFDDYWNPMLTGQGTHAEFVAGLPELTRHRIEATVKAAYLCNRPDGPRGFASIAWAVRGVVSTV